MATKTPNKTKQLLDKLSMSLKQTISRQAMKEAAEDHPPRTRAERERQLSKDTVYFASYMRIM